MERLFLFIIQLPMSIFANIASKFKVGLNNVMLFASIVFSFILIQPQIVFAQRGARIQTVVIDAGHGGKDPGASGKHSREKDIALAVALKLGYYIHRNLKDVKVIYTRKTDRFIPLYQRAEIANKNHADVFISIHCNSNPSPKPYGAETYVMGLHKNAANLQVAKTENTAILYEDNPRSAYDGFDVNSPQSYINLSLFQNTYLAQSLNIAHKIENQFKYRAGRKARGVYQAGFLVLWRTAMPSVLVELGYLSNPKEEAFLLSKNGQSLLASAIYRAFKEYKINFERENAVMPTVKHKQKVTKSEGAKKSHPSTGVVSGLEYRVQFFTSVHLYKKPEIRFTSVDDISVYRQGKVYKYTSGHFKSLKSAVYLQKKLRMKGYKGAFVVAFYKGKRISISASKKIISAKR